MEPVTWLPSWLANILYWITTHQTLLTGIAALFVGFQTVKTIQKQISQINSLERERRERRHKANMAGLTLSVVRIIEYADSCWQFYLEWIDRWDEFEARDHDQVFEIKSSALPFPLSEFAHVQATIESADDDVVEKLSEFATFAQIQASRHQGWLSELHPRTRDKALVVARHNIFYAARDALELRVRCGRILMYARKQTSIIEPLPGPEVVDEFLFTVSIQGRDDLEESLKKFWRLHYGSERQDP